MRSVAFIIVFFLLSSRAFCQNEELINFYKYDQSNGLSSPNIRKISKDYLGFIWIATQDGLNKFDGKQFSVFNSNSKNPYSNTLGSDFHDFCFDNNILWALTSDGGISKINITKSQVLATFNLGKYKIIDDWFHTICVYGSFVYVVTYKGKIIKFNTKTNIVEKITEIKSSNNENTEANKTRLVGNVLWIFTLHHGIIIYDLSEEKAAGFILRLEKGTIALAGVKVNDIFLDTASNKFLLASSIGILEADIKTRSVNFPDVAVGIFKKQESAFPVLTIEKYHEKIIFSTQEELYEFSLTTKKTVRLKPTNIAENRNWFRGISECYADGSAIFIGNQTGFSVFSFFKNAIVPYSRSATNYNIKIGHSTHLCAINDSLVYSCTSSGGLFKTNLISGEINDIDHSQIYFQAIKLNEGSFLFSGEKKMMLMQGQKLQDATAVFADLKLLNNDFIIASIRYNDSLLLMASQNGRGIYSFNLNSKKISVINKSSRGIALQDLVINNFYENKAGEILVMCDKSITVINLKNTTAKAYQLIDPLSKTSMEVIMDGTEIGDKYYFAVYGRGIVVTDKFFDVKKVISVNDGISNSGLYKIFNIGDSMFICSSNNGLFLYNLNTQSVRKLTSEDGLQSNNFEETSGFRQDDKILFGGENGFTVIYPKNLITSKKPPLFYFSGISVFLPLNKHFDTTDVSAKFYQISNDALQTTVFYSGINYSNPEKTTFAYRIAEQSKEWINVGTQNFVTPIGLSPGIYHLEVKAANEDGIWSEPKELVLEFLPKWYQTWWFKLLVLSATAGIVYAFYRYRIRQIKKQHEIRKNIATDLHDDLGSTLNSVKVFTNLAISGIKQEESLQQVKDNLTEATMSLRDMIWVLDDSLDTVDELITRLKQFAIPVASASNIDAVIKADSEVNSRQLTKEEKRNLFLVCKEAINNSIKYSGASQIQVAIAASGKKIEIVIADNGKGFNVDEVKKGYGLKNMQYRAGQIKYTITLTSALANGTRIIVSPL